MEELYGFHSTINYPEQASMLPENLTYPVPGYQSLFSSESFHDRVPIFGSSDELFSAALMISEDHSSFTPEIQVGGGERRELEMSSAIKAKIASHPCYPRLLEAYIDCQKVGAPPEIAGLLDEIRRENDFCKRNAVSTCLGADPELDEFMETYCDILVKYKSDLTRPFDEATTFLNKIELQFSSLCKSASSFVSDEAAGSSDEGFSGGEIEVQEPHSREEGRELKDKLLRKYSGYISGLKHEFSKKKKKGKLPKEARQTLLDWWSIHYKWPYPTEADKIALAETTGLDQKQINNWFINQRKRHWKPSGDMQFAVMDETSGPFFIDD